jgi:hypothetical protein
VGNQWLPNISLKATGHAAGFTLEVVSWGCWDCWRRDKQRRAIRAYRYYRAAGCDWATGGLYELLGGFWPGGPLCVVEFDDFTRLAQLWLNAGSGLAGDLDGDNDVDFDDLSWLADFWLCHCPVPWPMKEWEKRLCSKRDICWQGNSRSLDESEELIVCSLLGTMPTLFILL